MNTDTNNGPENGAPPSAPDEAHKAGSTLSGEQAKAAFDKAAALLKAGDVDGALAVELLPSDRDVIQERARKRAATFDTVTHN